MGAPCLHRITIRDRSVVNFKRSLSAYPTNSKVFPSTTCLLQLVNLQSLKALSTHRVNLCGTESSVWEIPHSNSLYSQYHWHQVMIDRAIHACLDSRTLPNMNIVIFSLKYDAASTASVDVSHL